MTYGDFRFLHVAVLEAIFIRNVDIHNAAWQGSHRCSFGDRLKAIFEEGGDLMLVDGVAVKVVKLVLFLINSMTKLRCSIDNDVLVFLGMRVQEESR